MHAIQEVLDSLECTQACAADQPEYVVSALEQELGEVRPVLPGNAGDQRSGHRQLRLPGGQPLIRSRARIAPIASDADILDLPNRRLMNTVGTSSNGRPARWMANAHSDRVM